MAFKPYNSLFLHTKQNIRMIRRIFFLLCISFSLTCFAQSIEKRYSSYISEKGTINFFRPKKLKNNKNLGKFLFDMTYVSNTDSVTINCSINITSGEMVSRAELRNGEKRKPGENVYAIYRNVTKKGYIIRLSARYTLKDIQDCFSSDTPLAFYFQLKDGTTCSASYTSSQWRKDSSQVTRILSSLNY